MGVQQPGFAGAARPDHRIRLAGQRGQPNSPMCGLRPGTFECVGYQLFDQKYVRHGWMVAHQSISGDWMYINPSVSDGRYPPPWVIWNRTVTSSDVRSTPRNTGGDTP